MNASRSLLVIAAAAGVLVGCAPDDDARSAHDPEAAHAADSVAPAITPPSELTDPAEPPSYEVGIATAAAQRNKALERCSKQPEAVRARCEQEANVSFAEAEASLETLRGNQP